MLFKIMILLAPVVDVLLFVSEQNTKTRYSLPVNMGVCVRVVGYVMYGCMGVGCCMLVLRLMTARPRHKAGNAEIVSDYDKRWQAFMKYFLIYNIKGLSE